MTATGLSLDGLDAGNYTVNATATTTAEITALHVLTITANYASKIYGETVVFTGTEFTTQGLVGGDSVTSVTLVSAGAPATATVGSSPYAIVASDAVGSGLGAYKIVYVVGILTVTPKTLTVSNVTAAGKVYDATDTAAINTSAASLNDVLEPDDVTLDTAGTAGSFADKNVGVGKTVTVSGLTLSGDDAGNYTLTQPTTTADITPAGLTVTGVTAANKVYDTNDTAMVHTSVGGLERRPGHRRRHARRRGKGGQLRRQECGRRQDRDRLGAGALWRRRRQLHPHPAGHDRGHHPRRIDGHRPRGVNKVYDATTAATVTLSNNHLGDDVVTSSYTVAGFGDQNVGTGKSVFVAGIAIGGADAGNYTLRDTSTTTTADITREGVGRLDHCRRTRSTTRRPPPPSPPGRSPGSCPATTSPTSAASPTSPPTTSGTASPSRPPASASPAPTRPTTPSTPRPTTTADIVLRTLTITPDGAAKVYGQTVVFTGTEFTAQGLIGEDTVTSVTLAERGGGGDGPRRLVSLRDRRQRRRRHRARRLHHQLRRRRAHRRSPARSSSPRPAEQGVRRHDGGHRDPVDDHLSGDDVAATYTTADLRRQGRRRRQDGVRRRHRDRRRRRRQLRAAGRRRPPPPPTSPRPA